MIKSDIKKGESKAAEGLINGPEYILSCSNCRKELVKLWKTRNLDFTCKFKAKCCYCGDSSYVKELTGGFHRSGIHIPNPDNPDDDIGVLTIVEDFEMKDDVVIFNTKKGPNA